jgi:DNA-binding CsgD family transcriptional regulator
VVAASRTGTGRPAAIAGVVTELAPLDDAAVQEMLSHRYGVPVDEAVLPALRTALGPLAGNPATVLQTTAALAHAGRLVVVRGHLCLLEPQASIPLSADHPLVTGVRRQGASAVRLATMVSTTRFHLDALPLFAEATLGRVDGYGRVLDRLVADGALLVEPDGMLRPRCPALAARFVADAGSATAARLHRAYAAEMLRQAGSGLPADRATLADHLASAGATLPADRRTAFALVATASEEMQREPQRAADWLDAALRHCDGAPAGAQILTRLLRLLVRTGQFSRLAEVVRAVPDDHPDLAAARALAALHTGAVAGAPPGASPAARPVQGVVDRWLTGIPSATNPSVERPYGGSASLVADAEFALVEWAFGGGGAEPAAEHTRPAADGSTSPADHPGTDQLLVAGAAGDLAHVFHLVLGSGRYRVPLDGPFAAYHRMLASRSQGDLPGVVSAARQVGLTGGWAPVPRRLARLWAAESLALRRDPNEAAAWLASVPDEPPYAALRWWVANGPAGEPASPDEASSRLDSALRAYRVQLRYGSRIGIDRLLVRAAGIAARFGLTGRATEIARLAEAAQPWAEPGRTRTTGALDHGTVLMVRALTDADPAVAVEAVDAIRVRGDRVELGYAVVELGRVVAEPRRWLLEALEIAEEIGSPWLRSAAVDAMRVRGVRRPRGARTRTTLSPIETRIIELIRLGRTNRQIAVGIRMSEKTVENYLTRLFARTGCRSRVELAAASLTCDTLDLAS